MSMIPTGSNLNCFPPRSYVNCLVSSPRSTPFIHTFPPAVSNLLPRKQPRTTMVTRLHPRQLQANERCQAWPPESPRQKVAFLPPAETHCCKQILSSRSSFRATVYHVLETYLLYNSKCLLCCLIPESTPHLSMSHRRSWYSSRDLFLFLFEPLIEFQLSCRVMP